MIDQRKFIGMFAGSLLSVPLVADPEPAGAKNNAKAFSAALFLATFVIPLAHRIGVESCLILPQDTQVIKNVWRKASSASSAIDEQFIEIGLQCFRVRPHSRDEIGDARI